MHIQALTRKLFDTGFFHIFGLTVVNKIVRFASSIILVRLLSKADYGTYAYAYNIFSFFIILNGMGSVSSILQLASENFSQKEKFSQYCAYGSTFGLIFSLIVCVAVLLTALFVPLPVEGSNFLLGVMCLYPAFLLIFETQTIILRSERHNQHYAYSETISTVSLFVCSMAGALILQSLGLILGQYIAFGITIIAIARLMKVRLHIGRSNLKREEKKLFQKIAFVSTLNNGLGELTYLLGTFTIGLVMASPEMTASYQVATVIPNALSFIPSSLVVYVYPWFAQHKDERGYILENFGKLLVGTGLLATVVVGLSLLLADPIIRLLFGAQYLDIILPFRILIAGFFFGAFRVVSGNLLVSQRQLFFNTFTGIYSTAIVIGLNFLLVPSFGMVGAASAQFAAMAVSGIASTVYFVWIAGKGKGI